MLNFLKRKFKKVVKPPTKIRPNHEERENRQKIEIVKKQDVTSIPQNEEKPKHRHNKIKHHPSQREERKHTTPKKHTVKHQPPELPSLTTPPEKEGSLRFIDLNVNKEILAACQDLGFEYCTPIQQKALPHTLKKLDLTGKAQTGTGKTAAFLISSINYMLNNPIQKRLPGSCRTVILAPTRELAMQIHKDAVGLTKYTSLHSVVVMGGMNYEKQKAQLANPVDILVGTPGRLLDFLRGGTIKLQKTEILIIDEADRMLDMGFIPDVRKIVYKLPPAGERQTLFFSATFNQKILNLVSSWLSKPITIEIESDNVVSDLIEQTFYSVTSDKKLKLLEWFLKNDTVSRMLIFVNRKDTALMLTNKVKKLNYSCDMLSGDVQQKKRISILERFRSGQLKIIVATDVAARGIHVDDVSHVVNYDLPYEPADYVHRIGRTGRAGNKGKSISLLCEYGAFMVPELEKVLGHSIASVQPEDNMLK
jgi:ATP-dependent RNA helicase RhlB